MTLSVNLLNKNIRMLHCLQVCYLKANIDFFLLLNSLSIFLINLKISNDLENKITRPTVFEYLKPINNLIDLEFAFISDQVCK